MSDAELIKTLRSSANRVVNYAGDRIEALTVQLAEDADARAVVDARREQLFNTLLIDVARLQTRAEKAEAEVLALREVIGAVNNEFGSAAWNWPDPWRRVAQLKELSNDRWKRAEKAEAERDRLETALVYAKDYLDLGMEKMAFNVIRHALKGKLLD